MNYAAPKGWIEVLPRSGEGSQHSTFHLRQDCERIKDRDQLREVDRPVQRRPVPRLRPAADLTPHASPARGRKPTSDGLVVARNNE